MRASYSFITQGLRSIWSQPWTQYYAYVTVTCRLNGRQLLTWSLLKNTCCYDISFTLFSSSHFYCRAQRFGKKTCVLGHNYNHNIASCFYRDVYCTYMDPSGLIRINDWLIEHSADWVCDVDAPLPTMLQLRRIHISIPKRCWRCFNLVSTADVATSGLCHGALAIPVSYTHLTLPTKRIV